MGGGLHFLSCAFRKCTVFCTFSNYLLFLHSKTENLKAAVRTQEFASFSHEVSWSLTAVCSILLDSVTGESFLVLPVPPPCLLSFRMEKVIFSKEAEIIHSLASKLDRVEQLAQVEIKVGSCPFQTLRNGQSHAKPTAESWLSARGDVGPAHWEPGGRMNPAWWPADGSCKTAFETDTLQINRSFPC